MANIKTTLFIAFICLLISIASSEPIPAETSSFAENSDGKGQVMVSCNGKTFVGEGLAACTSSASYSVADYGILGIVTIVMRWFY